MTWPAGGARQAREACPRLASAPVARRADPAWLVAADRGRDAAGGSSGPRKPRRSTRSPIRRTACHQAPAALAGTPRAISDVICRTPARQALRPGHQYPAPPGRGCRAKAVRPLGMRSHPSPPIVRQDERDVAGRAGRPLGRSPRNSSVNRDGSRDGSSVCCRPPALSCLLDHHRLSDGVQRSALPPRRVSA